MQMHTQKCIDGGSMIMGPDIITPAVMAALADIKQMGFTDQEDLECTENAVEEDNWEQLSEREKKIVCALMANVYSDYITDMDKYIDTMAENGVLLSIARDGTIIPCAEEFNGLEQTFFKTHDLNEAKRRLH